MPPTITVVTAPACYFCADAQAALTELGREVPLRVDLVAADSGPGQALVGNYRPAMFPLVLVDGVLFSTGRLPRRKLRALLAARPMGVRP
jgi:glutaredoxin